MERFRRAGRPRTARRLATLAVAAVAVAALAGPASATVIDRSQYSGSDAFSYDDCGFDVDVSAEFGGTLQLRVGTGGDASAFFAHQRYWWREVHVPRTGGQTLIVSGQGVFQETTATRVEGSVFEFSSINAGQPFVVSDTAGHILLMDRGVLRETILFDTLGDDVPGGQFIESVSFEVGGPHPGLAVDLCDLF